MGQHSEASSMPALPMLLAASCWVLAESRRTQRLAANENQAATAAKKLRNKEYKKVQGWWRQPPPAGSSNVFTRGWTLNGNCPASMDRGLGLKFLCAGTYETFWNKFLCVGTYETFWNNV